MGGKSVKGEGRGILQEDSFLGECHTCAAVIRLGIWRSREGPRNISGSADKEVGAASAPAARVSKDQTSVTWRH